ncbi:hypothetical protein EAS64_10580 [Trebonia kvetii]|uniref:Uncharacterized protein n=1 Tax=Trebonia kvetii TaxID=2480626 RepID=A0A6P2C1I0_9ACTN|nr:hypothetical protein [Trebonia kvetii]TVZ05058.1 hypothetical protein EAS64_10580 [Trebonia kvetii]
MGRLAGRVGVEEPRDASPGDDDARVPVPGRQDAQPPGLEVERGRVVPPAEGVEDDGDLVLGALQAVRGVDPTCPAMAGAVSARAWRTCWAWSRWVTPIAMPAGVSTLPPGWRSQEVTAPREISRAARAAAAAAASLSVRAVCRAGSSCSAHPVRAAVSRVSSRAPRIPAAVNSRRRAPGSVPAWKPAKG